MTDRRLYLVIGLIIAAWAALVIGGVVAVSHHLASTSPSPGGGGRVFSRSPAGKPLPSGPDAPTAAKLEPLWVGYYHKNLQQAYDRLGKRDPRWDKPAADLMEGMSRLSAYASEAPKFADMLPTARALQKSGCDDPLIQSLVGDVLLQTDHKQEAEPLVSGSLKGLQARHYPPLCLAWAYLDMARLHGEAGKSLERADFKWRPLAIQAYAQAAAEKFGPQEQRPLWWEISNLMEDEFRRSQAVIVMTVKAQPGVDPWLLDMAWGKHRYDFAVLAAGGEDYILMATGNERKNYLEGLEKARQYFEKAYAAHPEYPESSTYMIDVVKGLHPQGQSVRQWFDRAVAGQFDYRNAYYGMLGALHPWWGGSRQAQLAFAKECLDTQRFETRVPMMYQEIVFMVSGREDEAEIWADAQVWTNLQRYYEGALAYNLKADPKNVKPLRTLYALMAWRCGHPDLARTQLLALNGQLDKTTFDRVWGERAELFVGSIFAKTGPSKDRVDQAEHLFDSRQIPQALTAYQDLLKTEQDKRVRFFLQDRIQTLTWEKTYDAGQWVSLKPTPDFVGWDPWQGTIKPLPDGNGFITYPSERSTLMVCHLRPGDWYEIKCEVEFPDRKVAGIEAGFVANIAAGCANPYYDSYRVVRFPPSGFGGGGWQQRYEHALTEVPRKFQMRLVRCDRRITTYLNDETVFQDVELIDPGFRFEGWHNVGFGGEGYPDRSQPVIYGNIQIHRMGFGPPKR